MYKKIIYACFAIGILALQNCKSDGGDPLPAAITAPAVTLPSSITGVDGILAAISISTKESGTQLIVGSAYAAFYQSKNPLNKVEAGTVLINTKTATKSDDNIYFYTASVSEPKGLDYKNQVLWDVSDNTTNGVPKIYDNDGSNFPNMPDVPENLILFTNQDKLISWTSSAGADSVILIMTGKSATYKRVFNNTVSTHTIAAAEIAKMGKGSGKLEIISYKLLLKPFGTKQYAFIKQCMGICTKVSIN